VAIFSVVLESKYSVYKYLIATRDALYIFPLFSGFYGGSQLLSLGEALETVAGENVTGGLESSKTVNRRGLFFGLTKKDRKDHHEDQNTWLSTLKTRGPLLTWAASTSEWSHFNVSIAVQKKMDIVSLSKKFLLKEFYIKKDSFT